MFAEYDQKPVRINYADGMGHAKGYCIAKEDGTADIHPSLQDSEPFLTVYTAGDEIYAMGPSGSIGVVDSMTVITKQEVEKA